MSRIIIKYGIAFDTIILRGLINDSIANYKDALSDFNKALTEQPSNLTILQYKARVLFKLNEYEQSLVIYNTLIKNKSTQLLHMERAYIYYQKHF
jgi:tetratricopeptide (TPR) repeat protein